jgi:Tfp pilus assembly protein PilO
MMSARRGDRIWLVGGLLTIVALVAASWYLVISPKFAQADAVRADTETADLQLIQLKRDLAKLAEQEEQRSTFEANLRSRRIALPTSYNIPGFLRQMQDSGAAVDVEISGFNVSTPAKSVKVPTVVELPINLTAEGTPANLSRLIDRLQSVQTRAVLITAVSLGQGADKGKISASMSVTAFCLQATPVTKEEDCTAA